MKSSKSSKSNKPQRKRSAAADTVEAEAEIAAIVVAAGDKVVVVGEEEVGARHHRQELERGTFMLSRNDHKHYDTPGFSACDDTIGAKSTFCSGRQGHVSLFGGAAVERTAGLRRSLAFESGIDHEYGYGRWSLLCWRRHNWPPSV
jgi:hypothetical protein